RLIQALGGAYLVYLGWQAFRHAPEPLPKVDPLIGAPSGLAAYRRGFVVNMANPKVMVFFASVFASVYTPGKPEWINLAVLVVVALAETAWHSLVALALPPPPAQAAYGRAKRWTARGFGALLGLFGLKLLWNLRALAA